MGGRETQRRTEITIQLGRVSFGAISLDPACRARSERTGRLAEDGESRRVDWKRAGPHTRAKTGQRMDRPEAEERNGGDETRTLELSGNRGGCDESKGEGGGEHDEGAE